MDRHCVKTMDLPWHSIFQNQISFCQCQADLYMKTCHHHSSPRLPLQMLRIDTFRRAQGWSNLESDYQLSIHWAKLHPFWSSFLTAVVPVHTNRLVACLLVKVLVCSKQFTVPQFVVHCSCFRPRVILQSSSSMSVYDNKNDCFMLLPRLSLSYLRCRSQMVQDRLLEVEMICVAATLAQQVSLLSNIYERQLHRSCFNVVVLLHLPIVLRVLTDILHMAINPVRYQWSLSHKCPDTYFTGSGFDDVDRPESYRASRASFRLNCASNSRFRSIFLCRSSSNKSICINSSAVGRGVPSMGYHRHWGWSCFWWWFLQKRRAIGEWPLLSAPLRVLLVDWVALIMYPDVWGIVL